MPLLLTAFFSAAFVLLSAATAGTGPTALQRSVSINRRQHEPLNIQLGPRPFYLVEQMTEGDLKTTLQGCSQGPFQPTGFSIGHRGAPLQFPEHSKQSYEAAARMGAGAIECDVTFTQDKALVCRHAQCDLHATTNILATELAGRCAVPPDYTSDKPFARVRCCTSDLTLAQFKTLKARMATVDPNARTLTEYLNATPNWRTDLYATDATVMSHTDSIELFKRLGVKMIPELKAPVVEMPFDGMTRQVYAQKLIDEYKAAGVSPDMVFIQSFELADIRYWLAEAPAFGERAILLEAMQTPADVPAAIARLDSLAAAGVRIVAPPLWALVTVAADHTLVPSDYALAAKAAGLKLITWTIERSGPLNNGGGWYYQTLGGAIDNDGDVYRVLDVLARKVGVTAVFSDWPATATYFANCMGLK